MMSANVTISSTDCQRIEDMLKGLPATVSSEADLLRLKLSRSNLSSQEEIPPTVVTMNSTVRFVIEPTQRVLELTLVYPKDNHGEPDRVSVTTPLGRALLGLAVGQAIAWIQPGVSIRIMQIVYQPESAGNYYQ